MLALNICGGWLFTNNQVNNTFRVNQELNENEPLYELDIETDLNDF